LPVATNPNDEGVACVMSNRTASVVAALTASLAAAPALAQGDTDAQITAAVHDWVVGVGSADLPQPLVDYATTCFGTLLTGMPAAARATFLSSAGEFSDRMDAVVTASPDLSDSLLAGFQECGETLILGGQIYPWVVGSNSAAAPPERIAAETACYKDAIRPLSSDENATVFLGTDFAAGLNALILSGGDPDGRLKAAIDACGGMMGSEPAPAAAPGTPAATTPETPPPTGP
jgi:hypothetical protein